MKVEFVLVAVSPQSREHRYLALAKINGHTVARGEAHCTPSAKPSLIALSIANSFRHAAALLEMKEQESMEKVLETWANEGGPDAA